MAPRTSKIPKSYKQPGATKSRSRQAARIKKIQTGAKRNVSPGGGAAPVRQTTRVKSTATGPVTVRKTTLKKNKFGFATPSLGKLPTGTKKASTTKPSTPKPRGTSSSSTPGRSSTPVRSSVQTAPKATGGGGGGGNTSTKTTSGNGGKKTTAPKTGGGGTTKAIEEEDPITGLYAAARRDIERRRQIADATRLARLDDQKKFDEWVTSQRGTADKTLQEAFARTAGDAQLARQASYDEVTRLAGEATRQASGITDILQQAGKGYNDAAYGFRTAADAGDSAGGAFTQAALSQRNNQQYDVDRARAANMISSYNAQAAAANLALGEETANLSLQEIKDRVSQKNADRQFQLDSQAAQFLQGLKQGELEVKQYGAETDRLKTQLTARAQSEANKLRAQIAKGNFDLKKANLLLARKGYKLKERKQIFDEARAQAKARGESDSPKLRAEATEFMTKWNKDNLTQQALQTSPRGDEGIAYARSAVQALKAYNPRMTSQAALRVLASFLPGDVTRDNRILAAIDASFR